MSALENYCFGKFWLWHNNLLAAVDLPVTHRVVYRSAKFQGVTVINAVLVATSRVTGPVQSGR